MEDLILMPKYAKNKKPRRLRKPSRPIDGVNHRLLREQAQIIEPPEVLEIHDVPDDNAPPTRDELVQKAKELGIRVTKRTSDEKLLAKITEAIGG